MFSKLSDYLHTRAKGRLVLISFAALALFMGITLPLLNAIYPAGDELISLDEPVIYTSDEVLSIVENWGEGGRTYQLWFHLTWDVIVPVLNFLFLGLSFSWLLQRSFRQGSRWRMLNLVALVTVFDLLENVSLIGIIAAYPSQPIALAWLKTFLRFANSVQLCRLFWLR